MAVGLSWLRAEKVPVLPDGSVSWERRTISKLNGDVWTPESAHRSEAAELVRTVAHDGPSDNPINGGYYADIHRSGNIVLKIFNGFHEERKNHDSEYGFAALRANIMMEHGLRRQAAAEAERPQPACKHDSITLSAPTMLAAYIPHDLEAGSTTGSPTIWAMSYEEGYTPQNEDEVSMAPMDRFGHYYKGLLQVGMQKMDIVFDDKPKNLLIRNSPDGQHIVKLDVMA